MDKAKVGILVKRIAKALSELEAAADTNHISVYIIGGAVSIEDFTDIDNPKFSYYKNDITEELKIYE